MSWVRILPPYLIRCSSAGRARIQTLTIIHISVTHPINSAAEWLFYMQLVVGSSPTSGITQVGELKLSDNRLGSKPRLVSFNTHTFFHIISVKNAISYNGLLHGTVDAEIGVRFPVSWLRIGLLF